MKSFAEEPIHLTLKDLKIYEPENAKNPEKIDAYTRILSSITLEDYELNKELKLQVSRDLAFMIDASQHDFTLNHSIIKMICTNIPWKLDALVGGGTLLERAVSNRNLSLYQSMVEYLLSSPEENLGKNKSIKEEILNQKNVYRYLKWYVDDRNLETLTAWILMNKDYFFSNMEKMVDYLWVVFRNESIKKSGLIPEKDSKFIKNLNEWLIKNGFFGFKKEIINQIDSSKITTIKNHEEDLENVFDKIIDNLENLDPSNIEQYKVLLQKAISDFPEIIDSSFLSLQLQRLCFIRAIPPILQDLALFMVQKNVSIFEPYMYDILGNCIDNDNVILYKKIESYIKENKDNERYRKVIERIENNEKTIIYLKYLIYNTIDGKNNDFNTTKEWLEHNKTFFSDIEAKEGLANLIWSLYRDYSISKHENTTLPEDNLNLLKTFEQWLIKNGYQGFDVSQKEQINKKQFRTIEDWLEEINTLIDNKDVEKFLSVFELAIKEYPNIVKSKVLQEALLTLCDSKPPCERENQLATILIEKFVSFKHLDPMVNDYFDMNCMSHGNYALFYKMKKQADLYPNNPLYSGFIKQLEDHKHTFSYLTWMVEPPRNDYQQAKQWVEENKEFFSNKPIIYDILNVKDIDHTNPDFIKFLESLLPLQENHPLGLVEKCKIVEKLNNIKSPIPDVYQKILIDQKDEEWRGLPLVTEEGLLLKDAIKEKTFKLGNSAWFYLPGKIPVEKITPEVIEFYYNALKKENDFSRYQFALKIFDSTIIDNPKIASALYDHFLSGIFDLAGTKDFEKFMQDKLKKRYINYLIKNKKTKELDLFLQRFPDSISINFFRNDDNILTIDSINRLFENYKIYQKENPAEDLTLLSSKLEELLKAVVAEKRGNELSTEALSLLGPWLHQEYLREAKELIQIEKKFPLTSKLPNAFFKTPEYTVISNHEKYDVPENVTESLATKKTGSVLTVMVDEKEWPIGYNIFIPKHKKPEKFLIQVYGGGGKPYTPNVLGDSELYLLNHGIGVITLNLPDLLFPILGQYRIPEELFNLNLAAINEFITTFYHSPEKLSELLKEYQGSPVLLMGASFGGATVLRFGEKYPALHTEKPKILAGIISHDGALGGSAHRDSDLLNRPKFPEHLDPSFDDGRLEKLESVPLLIMQNYNDGNVNINTAQAFIEKGKTKNLNVSVCATNFGNPIQPDLKDQAGEVSSRGHFSPTEPVSKLRYAHTLYRFIQDPGKIHSDYIEWQIFKQSLAANQYHHNSNPSDKFQRSALRMLSKEKSAEKVVTILMESDNKTWKEQYEPLFKSHYLAYTVVRSESQCKKLAEILRNNPEYMKEHIKEIMSLQSLQMQYYCEEKHGITKPYSLSPEMFYEKLIGFLISTASSDFKSRKDTFFLEQTLTQLFITCPKLVQSFEILLDDKYQAEEKLAREKLKNNYDQKQKLQSQLVQNYQKEGLSTDSIRLLGAEAPSKITRILKQIPLGLDLQVEVKKYQKQYANNLEQYIPEYKLTVREMVELVELYNSRSQGKTWKEREFILQPEIKELRKLGKTPIMQTQSSFAMHHYQAKAEFLQFLVSDTWDVDLGLSTELLSEQRGQTCKLYALGHAMKALDPENAPKIRADKKSLKEGEVKPKSLRHAAKEKYDSRVGEMYSPEQLQDLAKDFGYEVDVYAPQTKEQYFEKIKEWLKAGVIPNIYFNVSLFQEDGLPEVAMTGEDFEHAGIITAYKETEAGLFFKVSHWGKHYVFNAEDLWRSIESMPVVQRETEVFVKGKVKWENVRDPLLIQQYKKEWADKKSSDKLFDTEGREVRVGPQAPNPEKEELTLRKTLLGVKKPK